MKEEAVFASKWMDPVVIQHAKVEYLDIRDRLEEAGEYPSIQRIRKEFSYKISGSTLSYIRNQLIESGEITKRKIEHKPKTFDPDYQRHSDEYLLLHQKMLDEGIMPSLVRMRERFSCEVTLETLSEVRRHLISLDLLQLGGPLKTLSQKDRDEIKRQAVEIKEKELLNTREKKKKRVWAHVTDKYIYQYRLAWKRIRRPAKNGAMPSQKYVGIEKRRGRYIARYWTPTDGRKNIGTFRTAKEAALARDRKLVELGLVGRPRSKMSLNFPDLPQIPS